MIVVVDYRMGNLNSIINMLKKIGVSGIISSNPKDIENADKLILPGVGAFDAGMTNIRELNLLPIIINQVMNNKTPILGICLGMQLLTCKSEEGSQPGLGLIEGETILFDCNLQKQKFKIPHMGWNSVNIKRPNPLFKHSGEELCFYFVHSYHVVCQNKDNIVTTTDYGGEFVSSIQKNNIFGTQFHPEKSHKYGLQVLKNFVELS